MKKIIALLTYFLLGAVCITGCTNSGEAYTEQSYTSEGKEITELCINVRDRQIEVMLSPDNQIHINYFESDKEYYDISVSDNHVLTMTAASDKEWTDYIGGKSADGFRKILLQVPDALLTALKIATTNENITLPALTVNGEVSLSSQGGNIIFDKLDVGNTINLKAKNGDITGFIAGSYDDYAISCDSKKGESNLSSNKKSDAKTLTVSNNNGDIDIEFISK